MAHLKSVPCYLLHLFSKLFVMDKILMVANRYAEGLKKVEGRRAEWLEHFKEVRAHLIEIATLLNETADYKPGYYVDTSHAYNEDINGSCAKLPSLTLRCGDMPLNVSFKSASGEKKEYIEEGFYLTFTPTITGQILVLLQPHYSTSAGEKPDYMNIAVIDHPAQLTSDVIDELVAKGMEVAFYTSFTGMVDLQLKEMEESQKEYHQPAPIGFKRYESTEKVK